jgi:ketosteroid isomerase-like protein
MKKVISLLFVLLIPFAASAQNWTAEQQEVIDHIKSCWDGWVKALEAKNYDIWADVCPCDKDGAYWFTSAGAPAIGQENQKRGLTGGLFTWWKKMAWLDLRPISIKIEGDVALVHFYGVWVAEDYKGEVSQIEDKRFEVFRKKDGQWTFIGGMVTPVPQN